MSPTLPLLAIPLYYILALYPHAVSITIATRGDPTRHDNRNPKSTSNLSNLQRKLSARDYAAYERGESCHRNALENMPLFVAAVFAGLLAERETGRELGTTAFCAVWLAVRVIYTGLYLRTETLKWSYARSLVWGVGVLACFWQIGRAAFAFS